MGGKEGEKRGEGIGMESEDGKGREGRGEEEKGVEGRGGETHSLARH